MIEHKVDDLPVIDQLRFKRQDTDEIRIWIKNAGNGILSVVDDEDHFPVFFNIFN